MKRMMLSLIFAFCWQSVSIAQVLPVGDSQTQPLGFFGEIIYHRAAVDGSIQGIDAEVFDTDIDLDGTFGLKDINGWIGKAGVVLYGAHEFVFDYRRYHLSKQTMLSSSVHFGDFTLPISVPVTPSLTFQSMGFFYGYRLINQDLITLSLRPGVEWVEYEVGVEASLLGLQYNSETYAGDYTVPFFWIVGDVKLHPMLSLTGELSAGWADKQIAYWGQAALKFTLHPNISALLGYSRVWFKDESDDERQFEVALSGLILGCQMVW